MYYPRQWLLTVQIMVNDLSFLMSRQLRVFSWSVFTHFSANSNYLFSPPFIIHGKTFSSWRHGIFGVETFHCVLCLIVGCGVILVALKKIAIVIRRTSKGNKVKIVARSFLVKTIRLNGMTLNFGRHSSSFRRHNVRRNDFRVTWPVSDWCVSSYKLYRPKKGLAQYWDMMRFQPYCINVT